MLEEVCNDEWFLNPVQIARFQDEGFLTLELLAKTSVRSLQIEADRLWAKAQRQYVGDAGWLSNALLTGVQGDSELFCDLLYLSRLPDIMTQLIGQNIKLASNQLTFKHPGDAQPYGWHQDNGYGPLFPETTVSCWLALDDVNESNGCLWILPRSHKEGTVNHVNGKPRERIAGVSNEADAISVPLRAGDCVLFHGLTLHMSKGNFSPNMRRAFFFRYADADAIEVDTGRPRVGKLLRGVSRFSEVTDCSRFVCHPKPT
jgi:hypothetical protein